MESFRIGEDGELDIVASPASSQRDFDFLIGEWDISNRKLTQRLINSDEWIEFDARQKVRKILHGLGNTDSFHAQPEGQDFEGMTLRLFDPQTRLWSIYWADSSKGVLDKPVRGSFYKNIGHFYTRDTWEGQDIIMAFRWDARDADEPVWSQAFSADEGQTWEWNWFMYMSRRTRL